jgi:hypothetical protein
MNIDEKFNQTGKQGKQITFATLFGIRLFSKPTTG